MVGLLMHLQRTAGNAAVGLLLSGGQRIPDATSRLWSGMPLPGATAVGADRGAARGTVIQREPLQSPVEMRGKRLGDIQTIIFPFSRSDRGL